MSVINQEQADKAAVAQKLTLHRPVLLHLWGQGKNKQNNCNKLHQNSFCWGYGVVSKHKTDLLRNKAMDSQTDEIFKKKLNKKRRQMYKADDTFCTSLMLYLTKHPPLARLYGVLFKHHPPLAFH